jgi:hypothetical protein
LFDFLSRHWRDKTGATVLPEKILRRLIMLRQQLLFSSHPVGFFVDVPTLIILFTFLKMNPAADLPTFMINTPCLAVKGFIHYFTIPNS